MRYAGPLGKSFAGDKPRAMSLQSRARVLVGRLLYALKRQGGKGQQYGTERQSDGSVIHAYVLANIAGQEPLIRTWIESPVTVAVPDSLTTSMWAVGGLAYVPMAISGNTSDPLLFGWQYISADKNPRGDYGDREGWWITAIDGPNGVSGNARIIERPAPDAPYFDKERGLLNAGWARMQHGMLSYFVREIYDGKAEDRNEVVSAGYTQMWYGRHCAMSSLDESGVGDMLGEAWTIKPWLIPVCGDLPLVVDPYRARIYTAEFSAGLTGFQITTFDEYEPPGFPDVQGAIPSSGSGGVMTPAHEYAYSWIYQVSVSQSGNAVFVFYSPVTTGSDAPDPGVFLMRHDVTAQGIVTTQEQHGYVSQKQVELDSRFYQTTGAIPEPRLTAWQESVIGVPVTLIGGVYGYCITDWTLKETQAYSTFDRQLVLPKDDTFDLESLIGFCVRDDAPSPIIAKTTGSLSITPTRTYGARFMYWEASGYYFYEDGRPNEPAALLTAQARAHVIERLAYTQNADYTTTISGLFGELITHRMICTSFGSSVMKTIPDVRGVFEDHDFSAYRQNQYGHRKEDTYRKTTERRKLVFYDAHNDVMVYEEWLEEHHIDILFTAGDEGPTHAYRRDYERKSEVTTHLLVGMSPGSPATSQRRYQFVTQPEQVRETIIDEPSSYIQIVNDVFLVDYFFKIEHEPLKIKTMQGQDVRLAYSGARAEDPNEFKLIYLFSNEDQDGNWQDFTHCGTEKNQGDNWMVSAGFPWGVDGRPLAYCFRIGDEPRGEQIS